MSTIDCPNPVSSRTEAQVDLHFEQASTAAFTIEDLLMSCFVSEATPPIGDDLIAQRERATALRIIQESLEPRTMSHAEADDFRRALESKFVPLTTEQTTILPIWKR